MVNLNKGYVVIVCNILATLANLKQFQIKKTKNFSQKSHKEKGRFDLIKILNGYALREIITLKGQMAEMKEWMEFRCTYNIS